MSQDARRVQLSYGDTPNSLYQHLLRYPSQNPPRIFQRIGQLQIHHPMEQLWFYRALVRGGIEGLKGSYIIDGRKVIIK